MIKCFKRRNPLPRIIRQHPIHQITKQPIFLRGMAVLALAAASRSTRLHTEHRIKRAIRIIRDDFNLFVLAFPSRRRVRPALAKSPYHSYDATFFAVFVVVHVHGRVVVAACATPTIARCSAAAAAAATAAFALGGRVRQLLLLFHLYKKCFALSGLRVGNHVLRGQAEQGAHSMHLVKLVRPVKQRFPRMHFNKYAPQTPHINL